MNKVRSNILLKPHLRRPRSSMNVSMGGTVCDEIKISALSKAAEISSKRVEESLLIKNEDAKKVLEECSRTPLPDSDDSDNEISDLREIVDPSFCMRQQLLDLELEQKKIVEDIANSRVLQLKINSQRIHAMIQERSRQIEKEREEEINQRENEILRLDATEKNRTSLVLQLQAKKHQEQAKKIDRLIEDAGKQDREKQEEHRHKRELLEKIILKQQRFRDVYQMISDLLKSCPHRDEMVTSLSSTVTAIRSLSEMMDTLVKQFKVGEVSQLDLTTAENLVDKLERGYSTVKTKVEDINRLKEQEQKTKESAAAPTPQQVPEYPTTPVKVDSTDSSQPAPATPEPVTDAKVVSTGLEIFISRENLELYSRLQTLLEQHLASLQPLEMDPKLKKFRFSCQMAVNTPLNAISAVSASHLRDKLRRLQSLLRGQPVEVSGSRVAASSHQLGVPFCLNLLAQRIVEQGEQICASKPEMAFPIAAVALVLWTEFPLFGDLLMAHFYQVCSYLVPYYAPCTKDQSDEDYYRSQGYRYSDDGQVEAQDKFLKRMTGTAHLFFAILTSKLPRDQATTQPPPPTLTRAWSWLAALLNLDPRPDISATVLLTFLEVAGNSLATTYGRQFNKIFTTIVRKYYPLIKQVSSGTVGPISRLELYLQGALKNGALAPPSGVLPPNFW